MLLNWHAWALIQDIRHSDAARLSWPVLQLGYQLEHYPLAPDFDWVVILCGINDMGRYLRQDYEVRARHIGEEALFQNPFLERLTRCAYYKRLYIWRSLNLIAPSPERERTERIVEQDPAGYWLPIKRRDASGPKREASSPPLPPASISHSKGIKRI